MEVLKDPCGDRACPSVPLPPAKPLRRDLLFPAEDNKPDIELLKDHLEREGRLELELLLEVLRRAVALFREESNLLKLKDPITVVGDLHGQYYDFLKLLNVGGDPSETQYLFLGDFVDRGSYSCEVLILLFCLKIRYPKQIWMLRGNHECRQMTEFFNFRDEACYKYGEQAYEAFVESFDSLPLGAFINGNFLGLHGGISPELNVLKDINTISRFQEPPRSGLFCDILWSDPAEEKEGEPVPEGWINNEVRGCSYFFGFDRAKDFLDRNQVLSIIRAHEAQLEGYKMHRVNEDSGFPTVITLFSAPNYCDVYNNKAAVLKFENNTLNILQFNYTAHPYHLPNFMDLFAWSVPFVSEKVTEVLHHIIHSTVEQDDENDDLLKDLPPLVNRVMRQSLSVAENEAVELAARLHKSLEESGKEQERAKARASAKLEGAEESGAASSSAPAVEEGGSSPSSPPRTGGMDKERADRLRAKIRTVSRMMRVFRTLRQEHETVVKLKGVCPGAKLKPGLLLQGKDTMLSELERFQAARKIDMENEKRPEQGKAKGSPKSPKEKAKARARLKT